MTDNLEPNDIVLSLSKALQLWYNIKKFLKIGHIVQDRVECYGIDIDNFEANIQAVYGCGITSFMTNKHVGDKETYCLHCLRFNILNLARYTWQNHQCGIGCYIMQGFEQQKKESKNCMRNFSNNK